MMGFYLLSEIALIAFTAGVWYNLFCINLQSRALLCGKNQQQKGQGIWQGSSGRFHRFCGGQPGGKTCVCRGMPFHRYCRAVRCQAGSVRVRRGARRHVFGECRPGCRPCRDGRRAGKPAPDRPQTAGADLLHRCLCRQQGKGRAEPHDTGRPARLWPQPPAAGTMGAGGLPPCADCAAACPIRHWAEKELFV